MSDNLIDKARFVVNVSSEENEKVKWLVQNLFPVPKTAKRRQALQHSLSIMSLSIDSENYVEAAERFGLLPKATLLQLIANGDVLPDSYEQDDKNVLRASYEHSKLLEVALQKGLIRHEKRERMVEKVATRYITESVLVPTQRLALPDYTGGVDE